MYKINFLFSKAAAKCQAIILNSLILLILSFSISSTAVAAATGYPLVDSLVGAYGDASDLLRSEVNRLIDESGIEAAATQAQDTLQGLAEGAVPVIDDIATPYHDKAEKAVADALDKIQLATNILNKIAGDNAKKTITFIQNSPIFAGADFGISTPTGRIRILVKDGEVSLCRTIVGPLGSVIVTGISNAKQLCHFPDERMANPTKSLLSFTYIAAGHTHIRVSNILVPNFTEDLTNLPAPIEAATYVKTIGGQYVQIRLAGADPASVNLDAKFEVGLKANGSYYVDIEAEGEAALSITGLKPLVAAEVIRSTSIAMLNKATELGLDIEVANLASNAATILKAGLHHLSDIEGDYEEGFGNVSVDVKLTGGIGIGFLDTAISAISANSTFNLTAPLVSFIEMRAGLLEEFLDIGLGLANVNLNLGTSILQGDQNALTNYKANTQEIVTAFANGVLAELLEISTKITSIESTFTLAILGDADKESIVVYESGLKLPVGTISTNFQTIPNALSKSFEAVSYLLLSALNPAAEITAQTWTELESVIVEGIEFTLRARNPLTGNLFGFKEADLLHTIKAIADIRSVLIGIINSSLSESLNDVREAIDSVVTTAYEQSDDVVIDWLNNASIEKSKSFGANGSIGAEAVAELGAKIELKGEVSGSLFLLLLDLPVYQKPVDLENPENDGLLASASMPINFSLDAGVSASEGVELTVDAGGKLSFNAFELTVKHWEGKLPTAALLKVAGFSVIEFDGPTQQDGSFSGSGYLMLPMGGIVSADFAVDQFGNVTSGTWSGGLKLGPLGDFPFIEGTIDNDGLHGTVNVGLLGSNFNANFILHYSGFLLGSYDGDITIAGHELLAASLYLGTDGEFVGHYEGDLSLGGFVATSNLDFNNNGFTGSSELTIFDSGLTSNDIEITRTGAVSGTFTGEIIAGSHTLSAVTLQAINGGFIGTAIMDLPGALGVEVKLQIFKGNITATYSGDFMGGLASQASMVIANTGINLSASLNTSALTPASSQAINFLLGIANTAQPLVEAAQGLVITLQGEFDIAEIALNGVQSDIDKLQSEYQGLIEAADTLVTTTQTAIDGARGTLRYWNNKIKELDDWYNGLGTTAKKLAWAAYEIDRAALVISRNIAQEAFDLADIASENAKTALTNLKIELDNKVQALKEGLQKAFDDAEAFLTTALNDLNQLLKEVSLLNMDAASIFSIQSISFKAGLSTLLSGNSFGVKSHLTFLGNQGQIGFSFSPANPSSSLEQIVSSLLKGDTLLSNSDKTPPVVIEESDFAQQAVTDAEQAVQDASNDAENQRKLLQEEYADLIFYAQLKLNDAHYEVNKLEAQIAQASSFEKLQLQVLLELAKKVLIAAQSALEVFENQLALKLLNLNQTLQNSINTANNQLTDAQNYLSSLNINVTGWQANDILIQLRATDNVEVTSITFSASGAQEIQATIVAGDLALIHIEAEGMTTLSFYATDISGNISETTTISISLDNSGPQISVTPLGISTGIYEVMINAKDLLGSGIDHIAVSASGAEYITESIELTDEVIFNLSVEGITTITITAVDVAGNSTTITHEVIVPKLFTDNDEPITTPDTEETSEGGGALGLLWMFLALMVIYLRRRQPQLNKAQKP